MTLRTTEVKVCMRSPNQTSFPIEMRSFNKKLNTWQILLDDGTLLNQQHAPDGRQICKLVLSSTEPMPIPGNQKNVDTKAFASLKRCFTIIKYIQLEDEATMANGQERLSNMITRKIHEFLNEHQNSWVVDLSGANVNTNCQTPLFEIQDLTASVRNEKKRNDMVSKYRLIISQMYEKDETAFVDLCFAANIPNTHEMKFSESLYNKMLYMIDNNPFEFEFIYLNTQRSLLALINRALCEPINNGKDTAISQSNGYYQFKNFAICRVKDDKTELMNYFTSNPAALQQLEKIMGSYLDRKSLQKLPAELNNTVKLDIEDLNVRPEEQLKENRRRESEIRQDIFNHTKKLREKGEILPEDWTNYLAVIEKIKSDNDESRTSFIEACLVSCLERTDLTKEFQRFKRQENKKIEVQTTEQA